MKPVCSKNLFCFPCQLKCVRVHSRMNGKISGSLCRSLASRFSVMRGEVKSFTSLRWIKRKFSVSTRIFPYLDVLRIVRNRVLKLIFYQNLETFWSMVQVELLSRSWVLRNLYISDDMVFQVFVIRVYVAQFEEMVSSYQILMLSMNCCSYIKLLCVNYWMNQHLESVFRYWGCSAVVTGKSKRPVFTTGSVFTCLVMFLLRKRKRIFRLSS